MKTPILILAAVAIAALGPSVNSWATFLGIVIVGVITAWNDRKTQKTLRENDTKTHETLNIIHLEVNNRLTKALKRIDDLEAQIIMKTGERADKTKE